MTYYLTELKYKDTIYTIADIEARNSLQNKADLEDGFISSTQLPPNIVLEDIFMEFKTTISEELRVINNSLNNKVDSITVASFVTAQDVKTIVESTQSNLVTTEKLEQKLSNYLSKTTVNDYITLQLENYVTFTVADETYAKISNLSDVAFTGKYEDLTGIPDLTTVVNSVNTYTGDVTLTAKDVQALSEDIDISEIQDTQNLLKAYSPGTGIKITPDRVIHCTVEGGAGYTAGDGIEITEENEIKCIFEEQDPVWAAEKASYATKEYTLAVVQNTNSAVVTRKGPTPITKPATAELLLDISSFNNVVISAFSIDTTEGELFIPLFSDQGVLKILKTKQEVTDEETGIVSILTMLTLTLSDTLFNMEWTNGYIYFSQFLDTGDSADTYWVDDYGTLFIVDANADGNPDIDSSQGILFLNSDNYTDITINEGVLEITTDS